jgi:hypothetical protein
MINDQTLPATSESSTVDGSARPVDLYRSAKALEELEARIAIRESELASLKSELQHLKITIARGVLSGTSNDVWIGDRSKPATVADAVEQILTERGNLEISVLLTELDRRYAIKTTKKDLANTLNRWITSRGKRFRRVGPNIFALKQEERGRRWVHSPKERAKLG